MRIADPRKLLPSEKLKIVEVLGEDFASGDGSFEGPSWHQDELRKTEAYFAAGKVEMLEWEDAKRELRQRFH